MSIFQKFSWLHLLYDLPNYTNYALPNPSVLSINQNTIQFSNSLQPTFLLIFNKVEFWDILFGSPQKTVRNIPESETGY